MAKRKRFSAQVDDQVRMVQRRLTAVVQQSTQEVIKHAQTPTAKGGRMRVKTGFLRNSMQVSFNGMPSGPIRGESGEVFDWERESESNMIAQIARTKPGEKIYAGWTASYARIREYRDGFLRGAMEQWQSIVDRVAERAKTRIR